MVYRQFDVVLVDFGDDVIGSEQGGVRPAAIVQGNDGNVHSTTALVMPFTKQKKNMYQPTHSLFVKRKGNGLKCNSVLLGECMRQVSEQRVIKYLGRLDSLEEREKVRRVYFAGFGEYTN